MQQIYIPICLHWSTTPSNLSTCISSQGRLCWKKLACMHGHGEIDFRKEKRRAKNKLVSTKPIFFRIFSNCSVIVLQKPHKISLLLDPKLLYNITRCVTRKLQLMMHKTEHVSFSRSQKLYNQPKGERSTPQTHTHRSSSTTTTGPWQHHHHPSLKQDRKKKKKHTSIQKLWSRRLCTQPTLQPVVVLLRRRSELYMQKWDANGLGAKWVFKKRRWQKNWD